MSPVDMGAGKPYPAYKASGVEWLGDVPAHWDVARTKSITSILNGATPSTNNPSYWDGDILWLTPDDLGSAKGNRVKSSARKITQAGYESCGALIAPRKSIVISTRAPIGHIAVLDKPACANQGCRLLALGDDVNAGFICFLLQSAREELQSLGAGTTFSELSRARLGSFLLTVPPIPEQAAIARFLDYMHRRITRCIEAKEKLIALLEEYRQVMVSDAVTGRFDLRTGKPYPAYKASGVEWLGDVPAHWQIERLKSLMQNVVDLMPACNEAGTVIALENVEGWTGGIRCIDSAASLDSQLKRFRAGDVLFGKLRPYLAKVTRPTTNGCCVGEFLVLRPRHRNVVESYVERILRSKPIIDAINSSTFGAKMPRADWQFIGRMPITLPPLPEQAAIARFLDRKTEKIAEGIFQAQNRIDLLHEYRTRLISDVVTGKLDVREAGAELPETESIDGFGESEVV